MLAWPTSRAVTLPEVSVAAVILAAGAGTACFYRESAGALPGAKLLARARGKPLRRVGDIAGGGG